MGNMILSPQFGDPDPYCLLSMPIGFLTMCIESSIFISSSPKHKTSYYFYASDCKVCKVLYY